ncbi:MAG: universal stress protein [Thermomicrobiales bacterium]
MTDVPSSAAASTSPIGRILVPLDGSDVSLAALDYASRFPGATLVVLQVGVDLDAVFPEVEPLDFSGVDDAIRDDLRSIVQPLVASGRALEVVVEDGDPADRIVEVAQRERADLIVMTTRGRGAASRILFGSVADRVSRHATVPAILVRTGQETATDVPARILVALDGSSRAEAALPVASRLASSLGTPLVLVRAVTLEDSLRTASLLQGTLKGRAVNTTDEAFTLAREETERRAQAYLDGLAAGLGGSVSSLVLHGAPAGVLLQETGPGELTILTSHGTSGVSRWLLGSVAEKLVREAAGPVCLVPARTPGE